MPGEHSAREIEAALLREQGRVILAAFERVEPSPTWAGFRDLLDRARRLTDLRAINRDLRGAMAALSDADRQELMRTLRDRFGPDVYGERDQRVAEETLARGRIRSENESGAVQAYADSIAGDRQSESKYLALGALLDDFTAAPLPEARSRPNS